MTDARKPDQSGDPLPPEAFNDEQEDESTQAQTLADEALGRATSGFGEDETEKVPTGDDIADSAQDLVDHMKQMETSGIIDNSAFAGERNDDEEDDRYGGATLDE